MWTEIFLSIFQTRNNRRVYYERVTRGSVLEFRSYNVRISGRLPDIMTLLFVFPSFPLAKSV